MGIVKFEQLCMKEEEEEKKNSRNVGGQLQSGYSEAATTAASNKDTCRNPPTSNNKSTEPTACSAGRVSYGKEVSSASWWPSHKLDLS